MTKAACSAEQLNGETIIERAPRLKDVAQIAGLIHGWNSQDSQQPVFVPIQINIG